MSSVMAKTLSTDNYLQITQLMQAPVAERGNIIFSRHDLGTLANTSAAYNDRLVRFSEHLTVFSL